MPPSTYTTLDRESNDGQRRTLTAIIGFCTDRGAFLAADTRRHDVDSGVPWSQPIQKIALLTERVVVATGGLGTFGHQARDRLADELSGDPVSIPHLAQSAAQVFRRAYQQSQTDHPGHAIPLTCVMAGQDPASHGGFICSVGSRQDFQPLILQEYGRPYFTGSNTALVVQVASTVIRELRSSGEQLLHLDVWALESFTRLSASDNNVALPAQLVLVRDDCVISLFPVDQRTHSADERFETRFPEL